MIVKLRAAEPVKSAPNGDRATVCVDLALAFQEVRQNIFGVVAVDVFAKTLGLKQGYIAKLENLKPENRVHPDKVHEIIVACDRAIERAVEPGAFEKKKAEILSHFSRLYGGGIYGLLYSWLIEAGPEKFHKKTGMKPSYISDSKSENVPFSFAELRTYADSLFKVEKSNKAFWNSERGQAILTALLETGIAFDRSREGILLHAMVECAGGKITAPKAKSKIVKAVIPAPDCVELAHHRLIPREAVEPIVNDLVRAKIMSKVESDEFLSDWESEYANQSPRINIQLGETAAKRRMKPPFLAECLGIKESYRSGESYRVRDYLDGRLSYTVIPVPQMAILVAETSEEFEQWVDLARADIARDIRRRMVQKKCPRIFVERILWGVELKEIENYDLGDLKKLEIKGSGPLKEESDEVVAAIEAHGREKLRIPIQRLLERISTRTVKGFYRSLLVDPSLRQVEARVGSTYEILTTYSLGADVPNLVKLGKHAQSVGRDLDPSCRIDWYLNNAENLCARNYSDLARVMFCISQQYSDDPIGFIRSRAKRRKSKDNIDQNAARMSEILRTGILQDRELRDLLDDLGYARKDPQRVFIELVNKHGCVSTALSAWRDLIQQSDNDSLKEALDLLSNFCVQDSGNEEGSIEDLIEDRFYEHNSTPTELQEKILQALKVITGSTKKEIAQLGADEGSQVFQTLRSYGERLKARGITAAFALHLVEAANPSLARMSKNEAMAIIYQQGRLSPLLPPALWIALAADSKEEAVSCERELRKMIAGYYEAIGIMPIQARIDLVFYGLQIEDLSVDYHSALRTIVGDQESVDPEDQRTMEQEIATLGLQRTNRSLSRLSMLHRSTSLSRLINLYQGASRGKRHIIRKRSIVSTHLLSGYVRGTRVPTYPRFKSMLKTVGLKACVDWETSWHLAYAELVQKKMPAFARLFNAGLMSGNFPLVNNSNNYEGATHPSVSKEDLERALLKDLAVAQALNPKSVSYSYGHMLRDGCLKPEVLEQFIACLGYPGGDKRVELLTAANDAESDLVSIAYPMLTDRSTAQAISYIAEFVKLDRPDLVKKYQIVNGSQNGNSVGQRRHINKAGEVIRLLAGLTIEEILILDMCLNFGQHMKQQPDLESKLTYLDLALQNGAELGIEELNGTFENHSLEVKIISDYLGVEFLPYLLRFKFPQKALTFLADKLRTKNINRRLAEHIDSRFSGQENLDPRAVFANYFE